MEDGFFDILGAADTAHELLDVIRENDAEPEVVGSDGTATNTGPNSGVNRRLELGLGNRSNMRYVAYT